MIIKHEYDRRLSIAVVVSHDSLNMMYIKECLKDMWKTYIDI